MAKIPKPVGSQEIVYSGQIIEVSQQHMQSDKETRIFEKAKRPPGTRLIIIDQEKKQILLTKEYRIELGEFDYRLPGGKVCDSLKEFNRIKNNNDFQEIVKTAAILEAKQETGIIPSELSLFSISKNGATIEWDLYYFTIDSFVRSNQDLDFGENITVEMFDYQKAIDICLSGKMKEDRSIGVLMKFFRSINVL